MTSTPKKRFPLFPVILLSLFITAVGVGCGGGGGGTPPPPPPPAIEDAQGLFTTNGDGSAVFKDGTNPDIDKALTDIKGMVYGDLPNQKFIFFDIGTNVLYKGNITAVTPNITGTATVYNDGVVVENNVVVSGAVVPESSIDLTFTGNGDFVTGTIKGLFSAVYNNAATSERIRSFGATPWRSSIFGSAKMVLADMKMTDLIIDTNGTYTYSTSGSGADPQCGHNGKFTSGVSKNIYPLFDEEITDFGNCTIANSPAKDYTGMASVVAVDGAGNGTEMWYATTNASYSIFAILTR